MSEIRWCILFAGLLLPALTDILFMSIEGRFVIAECIAAVCMDCICGLSFQEVAISLAPGMILWILSCLSKGIGMGDVMTVFFIGLVSGWNVTMNIVFLGSIGCLVAQLVLNASVKIKRKTQVHYKSEFAFIPCLLIASFIIWLAKTENIINLI